MYPILTDTARLGVVFLKSTRVKYQYYFQKKNTVS